MEFLSYPAFDTTDKSSVGQRWAKYIARFQNYMTAMNIEDPARKKAILLHFAGEEVHDIFDGTTFQRTRANPGEPDPKSLF